MKQNNKKISITNLSGFTLVELLVVISIIGILAGIVYANFGDARASARDEARKVALKEMQLAIELYKAQNGRYPEACRGANKWSGGTDSSLNGYACGSPDSDYVVGLVPDYIVDLPFETATTGNKNYLYRVNTNGTNYKLLAYRTVEKNLVTDYNNEFARCPKSFDSGHCGTTPQATTYAVYSAGAASW